MIDLALDGTQLIGARTGIGTATLTMFQGLATRPEVSVLGYALTLRRWRQFPTEVPSGIRPLGRPLPANLLVRIWSVSDFARLESWAGPVDVVHGTNYVVPPTKRARSVLSVWDLTPVHYPELSTRTSLLYPRLVQRAIDRGAWIHTASEFVAAEVCAHFGADRNRVRVIPPGLIRADVIRSPATPTSIDPGEPAKPKPEGKPYILFLGTSEPRKNLPLLIEAFQGVADCHRDVELWLVGPPGWGDLAVSHAIDESPHRERIRRLGWVADASTVLSNAAVLAYPSLYEGFGYPPLEAMAAGVPVVASSVGSIPEVTSGAAVLVPPRDVAAWSQALLEVLESSSLRAQLIERGKKRAETFSIDQEAEELVRLYLDVS